MTLDKAIAPTTTGVDIAARNHAGSYIDSAIISITVFGPINQPAEGSGTGRTPLTGGTVMRVLSLFAAVGWLFFCLPAAAQPHPPYVFVGCIDIDSANIVVERMAKGPGSTPDGVSALSGTTCKGIQAFAARDEERKLYEVAIGPFKDWEGDEIAVYAVPQTEGFTAYLFVLFPGGYLEPGEGA